MKKDIPVKKQSFTVTDPVLIKLKVLNWAKQFGTFSFLDNHGYQLPHQSEECLLAAGVTQYFSDSAGSALHSFQQFLDKQEGWLFGHLGYDLKSETESVPSLKESKSGFADIHFFEPAVLLRLTATEIYIEGEEPAATWEAICNEPVNITLPAQPQIFTQCSVTKEEYIATAEQLRKHIHRGDCYEINYCVQFEAQSTFADPLAVYQRLSAISPNPFSALYKTGNQWLLCASPERFLKKENNTLISQPIKGTAARVPYNKEVDEKNRDYLYNSAKDRSENVMIVDLVRNDLSRVCEEGTVKVDELFGIYSFPQVHQMISTISGTLRKDVSFTDIIRATFPMGSMTGAPKRRVLELIEIYEKSKRGIFSGAVGYISPTRQRENGQADFDFNVIIRSIIINADTGYLSFPVGSAITYYSDPEKEWEECLLKAAAMRKALGQE